MSGLGLESWLFQHTTSYTTSTSAAFGRLFLEFGGEFGDQKLISQLHDLKWTRKLFAPVTKMSSI